MKVLVIALFMLGIGTAIYAHGSRYVVDQTEMILTIRDLQDNATQISLSDDTWTSVFEWPTASLGIRPAIARKLAVGMRMRCQYGTIKNLFTGAHSHNLRCVPILVKPGSPGLLTFVAHL